MTISKRLAGAAAALAVAAAPAVALAHGHGRGPGGPGFSGDHAQRAAIGAVTTFTGGVLTVTLNDGTAYSGKIVNRTVLLCDSAPPASTTTPPSTPTPASTDTPTSTDTPSSTAAPTLHGNGRGHLRHDRRHGRFRGLCSTDALTANAKVADARIVLTQGGGVWKKVELLP